MRRFSQNFMSRLSLQMLWVVAVIAFVALFNVSLLRGQEQSGVLTVRKIYGQPGLSGKLYRGVQWAPDGKTVTFFEVKGTGKDAKTELWALDVASGQRRLLVSAEKLETVLPAGKTPQTQATGLGRHPASQYLWAPNGEQLLFVGTNSLSWFDLKTQASRTLLQGKEAIADVKISPDGHLVSFVQKKNLFVLNVAEGKERAVTHGGTEEIRKGELDWVYPEELDLKTAYWWSPDSSKVAFLEMDESKVSKYPLVDFASFDGDAEQERYPIAGGSNPIVHVFAVSVNGGNATSIDTGAETNVYIPRVDWLRDSQRLAIQR